MATTEIREKETETACPGKEFFAGLALMLKERTKIKIALVSQHNGDIAFISTYADLGITPKTLNHPFYHTNIFADVLGYLLVSQNLDLFSARIMDKFYNTNVREYNHQHFGLRTTGTDILMFQCHSSLIYHLVNEQLNREIAQEVAKLTPTIACPKKVKREDETISVTSYSDDDKNLSLVVTKGSAVRVFKEIIETILNFYGIKGKDVFVNDNYFDYQIEIKDK